MREILLKGKAQEVSVALEEWAAKKRILGPGERIVFSLKIESVPTVCRNSRDTEDEPPRQLTILPSYYRRSTCVPTVPMADDLIIAQEIISLLSNDEYSRFMQSLLIFHRNVPMLVPIDGCDGYSGGERMNGFYEGINKILTRNPVHGVYYRLVRNSAKGEFRQHYYQLFCALKREKP